LPGLAGGADGEIERGLGDIDANKASGVSHGSLPSHGHSPGPYLAGCGLGGPGNCSGLGRAMTGAALANARSLRP
jgi:hypothetical protein